MAFHRPFGTTRKRITLGILTTAAAVPLLATPATADAPKPTPAPSNPAQLKVLNWNVMLLSDLMSLEAGKTAVAARAASIADSAAVKNADVIVLEELFSIAPSEDLLARLHAKGFTHQTKVVGSAAVDSPDPDSAWDGRYGHQATHFENGGVAIVSKHKISRREEFVYRDATGADKHAAKGFAYAKVEKNGSAHHIFGTHPQAEADKADIRQKQFDELDRFISEKERNDAIPRNEPVIIAGDMNVHRSDDEYRDMLSTLGLQDAPHSGGNTLDTVGNDIARHRYNGHRSEVLDYVLFRKGHPIPKSWANKTIKVKMKKPVEVDGSLKFRDYSDHYPVLGYANDPYELSAEAAAGKYRLTVRKVTVKGAEEKSGDEVYGTVAVNGTLVWARDDDHPLDDQKAPYTLPGVSAESVTRPDDQFRLTLRLKDFDPSPLDSDEQLFDTVVNLDATPGTHTARVAGTDELTHGEAAAEVEYHVEEIR
ncbi:sphingomyelin phosphodiesterase [Streptomyces eurocidicus]|uniref:Sphingomyelin phosphodiesterase n=1 Tax=Streptomyces eurocidicus TaxID=66423 RepID=A0A7W8BFZ7_STREU|nr:sphingomyelin phosphodiesterase [Streptomyces eurocidicus]MBB5121228.1 sphingomyelin phosphodiesterase [Streptomyces eurocidicus]MBF6055837.1 hypothetical protein [Streptomyces eurocidicus]